MQIAGFKNASQTINLQTEEIMTEEIEKVPKEKDNVIECNCWGLGIGEVCWEKDKP